MDIYLFLLVLGGVGLGAMALSGVAHSTGHSPHGLQEHGALHGDAGHAGHTVGGHGSAMSHGHHLTAGPTDGGAASDGDSDVNSDTSVSGLRTALAFVSPRILFSTALGVGTGGIVLRSLLPGFALPIAALIAGIAFERVVVNPLWKSVFRFESRPAETLEHSITQVATAVTSFDTTGHGLVALEVDGQVVQLLATLRQVDRERGIRVRSGDRVRVEDVDPDRNRCTVSPA